MNLETCNDANELYEKICIRFKSYGLFEKELLFEHCGSKYKIKCDSKSFVVFRIPENSKTKHQPAGWPVCIVTKSHVFEEATHCDLGEDHFSCGLILHDWLHIVDNHFSSDSD